MGIVETLMVRVTPDKLCSRMSFFCSTQIRFSANHLSHLICQIIFICVLFSACIAHAQTDQNDLEYRIKAAYLYNLSKFIQWPDEPETSQEPIDICLFHSNPFKDYIYKLEQRKARGRPIRIISLPSPEKLKECEMVFVPINTPRPEQFFSALHSSDILTVGESEIFIKYGGLINLSLENGRVQLSINNTKAKKQGFVISANLLEIARQVE
jgi:hypothetical protein